MKISKRKLIRIIREEYQKAVEEAEAQTTEKYDDDPALKGDQDELPDQLQKGIIDKAEKGSKKIKENAKIRLTRHQLRRIVNETMSGKKKNPLGFKGAPSSPHVAMARAQAEQEHYADQELGYPSNELSLDWQKFEELPNINDAQGWLEYHDVPYGDGFNILLDLWEDQAGALEYEDVYKQYIGG